MLKEVILPILLVIGILGSIFSGIATPTEAAAVGALGSVLITWHQGFLKKEVLISACVSTIDVVGSVMWVIFAASCFATIYQGLGATQFVRSLIVSLDMPPIVILIIIQAIWIVLGCLMDSLTILLLTAPIFLPVVVTLGFDLVWFGVLFVVNCEMGYLTPPFGVNLVALKGVVKDRFSMGDLYNSVWAFVVIQFIVLVLCIVFPKIITWVL